MYYLIAVNNWHQLLYVSLWYAFLLRYFTMIMFFPNLMSMSMNYPRTKATGIKSHYFVRLCFDQKTPSRVVIELLYILDFLILFDREHSMELWRVILLWQSLCTMVMNWSSYMGWGHCITSWMGSSMGTKVMAEPRRSWWKFQTLLSLWICWAKSLVKCKTASFVLNK